MYFPRKILHFPVRPRKRGFPSPYLETGRYDRPLPSGESPPSSTWIPPVRRRRREDARERGPSSGSVGRGSTKGSVKGHEVPFLVVGRTHIKGLDSRLKLEVRRVVNKNLFLSRSSLHYSHCPDINSGQGVVDHMAPFPRLSRLERNTPLTSGVGDESCKLCLSVDTPVHPHPHPTPTSPGQWRRR